jgi:hypothetical protein
VYGPFLQQFTPAAYTDVPNAMIGFMMYSKTSDKKEKESNTYEVVKVSNEKTIFNQTDYKFDQVKK